MGAVHALALVRVLTPAHAHVVAVADILIRVRALVRALVLDLIVAGARVPTRTIAAITINAFADATKASLSTIAEIGIRSADINIEDGVIGTIIGAITTTTDRSGTTTTKATTKVICRKLTS